MDSIVAVTVTHNRTLTLKKCVKALQNQSQKLTKIVIVDCDSKKEEKDILKEMLEQENIIEVLWLKENVGGAGGFEAGMRHAFKKYNPDWIWIMDDDAYPKSDCLSNLLKYKNKLDNIGFLAPLIYGVDFKEYQLYHHKVISKLFLKEKSVVTDIGQLGRVREIDADAFVGPLFSREIVKDLGYPWGKLFIYGDDLEYTYRITRKYKGYLIKEAVVEHQDPGTMDRKKITPQIWWKEYYAIRNKYLIISKYKKNSIKVINYIHETIHVGILLAACLLYKKYKGYKKFRIRLLARAIKDGLSGLEGKAIDPNEYIESIKKIRAAGK